MKRITIILSGVIIPLRVDIAVFLTIPENVTMFSKSIDTNISSTREWFDGFLLIGASTYLAIMDKPTH